MPAIPTDRPVGIVGAGTMGAGIAEVAAVAGHEVTLYDVRAGVAGRAVDEVRDRLAGRVERGRLEPEVSTRAASLLSAAERFDDLARAAIVVEAAIEDLAVKRELFGALEKVCPADTVLATNTSTLSVTTIAAGLNHPERVCGMHFFNPAPAMALVEVPVGAATAEVVAETVAATARAWGKTAVRCRSTPGFVVNRVARPFYGEAQRMLEEGLLDVAGIDALLRESAGFAMGPFELADLVGNDVNLAVTESVWQQTDVGPRYAPTQAQRELVAAGRLGRKTGRGWYDYGDAATSPVPRPEERDSTTPGEALAELVAGVAGSGAPLPGGGRLIDVATPPPAGGAEAVRLDLVAAPDRATRVCLAPTAGCRDETVVQAVAAARATGVAVTLVDDSPGLVVARTLAMLVNEAADVVCRGEATAADVDVAMRLGTAYPLGPFEWADRIGPALLVRVLVDLDTRWPSGRYRVSPLLSRAATTGTALRAG